MTLDEPPATPKLRLVGMVWGVVGIVALVVGLLAKLSAVAIFGGLALLAGIVVYSAQSYREASAARTQRRLAGGPVSPMSAPGPAPDVGPGSVPSGLQGRAGYRRRPWLRNDPHEPEAMGPTGDDPHAGDANDGNANDGNAHSGDAHSGEAHSSDSGDGLSDVETGDEDTHSESISEQDDGYGNTPDGDDVGRT